MHADRARARSSYRLAAIYVAMARDAVAAGRHAGAWTTLAAAYDQEGDARRAWAAWRRDLQSRGRELPIMRDAAE